MIFTAEVKAALATLRNAAQNDFERHRLDVLEQDLTSPPTVEVIDDTHQKFNGIVYRKMKDGHFQSSSKIHRDVQKYFFGVIPDGYVIHHIDNNPANNDISNLQCITRIQHSKIHAEISGVKPPPHPLENYTCDYCGKKFTKQKRSAKWHFCSRKCESAYMYRCLENQEKRTCAYCGKEFFVNKHATANCCCNSCAQKLRFIGHSSKKVCPVCGKTFETISSQDNVCCSHKCASTLMWQSKPAEYRAKTRQCKFCGKEFTVKKKTQSFCSKSCATKQRYKKA